MVTTAFKGLGRAIRDGALDAGSEEFWKQVMQMILDHAESHLRLETPREYVQQLASASEALRRARSDGGAGGSSDLEKLRLMLEPHGGH